MLPLLLFDYPLAKLAQVLLQKLAGMYPKVPCRRARWSARSSMAWANAIGIVCSPRLIHAVARRRANGFREITGEPDPSTVVNKPHAFTDESKVSAGARVVGSPICVRRPSARSKAEISRARPSPCALNLEPGSRLRVRHLYPTLVLTASKRTERALKSGETASRSQSARRPPAGIQSQAVQERISDGWVSAGREPLRADGRCDDAAVRLRRQRLMVHPNALNRARHASRS